MARNSNTDTSLDSIVRRIVREELREMFSGFGEDSYGDPTMLNVQDDEESAIKATSGTRRRRKRGSGTSAKGRVTNPNDKRLKANREANA